MQEGFSERMVSSAMEAGVSMVVVKSSLLCHRQLSSGETHHGLYLRVLKNGREEERRSNHTCCCRVSEEEWRLEEEHHSSSHTSLSFGGVVTFCLRFGESSPPFPNKKFVWDLVFSLSK